MKIDNFADTIVVQSHEFDSRACTIDAEDMKYITSLLRNNYSNTILATVREVYANAVDANAEANKDASSIIVTLPTNLSPEFSVRDFGSGLSQAQMFELYTKYGKSTKRTSNSVIGGFGIGRFAPLSYNKDGFTITSFVDGVKTIYFLYISEDNDTKLDQIFSGPSDEPNGILISVAVNTSDISYFVETCRSFFAYFEILPKFQNLNNPIIVDDFILKNNNWKISVSPENKIIIGGIAYALDLNLIGLDDSAWIKNITGLLVTIPIGSVKIHHSREALEYNKLTKEFLKEECAKISIDIENQVKELFQKIDCYRQAKIKYGELKRSFPRELFSSLHKNGVFYACGIPIVNENFTELYFEYTNADKLTQTRKIPVYFRGYHLLESGHISNSRCYSLASKGNTAYVFNDLSSTDKISNRVYSLLSSYENVIVISNDNSLEDKSVNGVNIFYQQNHFDLVKTGVFFLSKLTPSILPKKAKSASSNYSPSYFFVIERKTSIYTASTTSINDTSVVKPFIWMKNRKPFDSNNPFSTEYQNIEFFGNIASRITDVFGVNLYGVSTALAETKKFSSCTHFVPLKKYVSDMWDKFSKEEKDLFYNWAIYKSEWADGELSFFEKAQVKNPFSTDFASFLVKRTEIEKEIVRRDLNSRFGFFQTVFEQKKYFGIDYKNLVFCSEVDKIKTQLKSQYPHCQAFLIANQYDWRYGNAVEEFASYCHIVNEHAALKSKITT